MTYSPVVEPVGVLVTTNASLKEKVQQAWNVQLSTWHRFADVVSHLKQGGAFAWVIVDIETVGWNLSEWEASRRLGHRGPLFAMAREFDGAQLVRLALARAHPLPSAIDTTELARLLDAATRQAKIYLWLRQRSVRWCLTRREQQILQLSFDGVPRSVLPDVLGTTENTLKTHVRSLLRKARRSSISAIVADAYGVCLSPLTVGDQTVTDLRDLLARDTLVQSINARVTKERQASSLTETVSEVPAVR